MVKLWVVLCICTALPLAVAQDLSFLTIQARPELMLPVADSATYFKAGGGASVQARIHFLPVVYPYLYGSYVSLPTSANKSLGITSGGLGIGGNFPFGSRMGVSALASGGVYSAAWGNETASNLFYRGGADVYFRFSPAFAVSLGGSYQSFAGKSRALYDGVSIDLGVTISFAGLRETRNINNNKLELKPVYPVLYGQYDKNSLGNFSFTNQEDGEIENVKVSFFVKQFMERPKQSASYAKLERGGTVNTPLYALFTSEVLKLTESTKVLAEVEVEYEFLGLRRVARFEESLRMNNRNAMTWDDDRKASAFVSAKDPAVLRYTKYVAGAVRDAGLPGINQNLRYALGLFEGLKSLELNYVIDPTTPYAQLSEKQDAVDYLQFPFQTISYRGGDCDDLSIMFCAMLESVGIPSAFVTVPGHIYTAFDLDLTEAEARESFSNPDELIYIDGQAWMPVETTLLKDGFLKAWTVGAKQWNDNKGGTAALFKMHEAWKVYDPVGPPDQDTRVTLPALAVLSDAFKEGIARFINRELPKRLGELKAELAKSNNNPRILNKLGVLYARYGQYKEAKEQFQAALKGGYAPAYTNLANVAFLQKDYAEARRNYELTLKGNPEDSAAMIGLARTLYEMEDYASAAKLYEQVREINPTLAAQYEYLESKGAQTPGRSASASRGDASWD